MTSYGIIPGDAQPSANSLLDQSLWWIVPAAGIAILMVMAMMEFTLTLIAKPPPKNRKPVGGKELRRRLMALNEEQTPYRIVEGKPWDLELVWDVVDASWQGLFAKIKLTTVYRARMLLDESRHEARWFEYLRSSNFFLGFDRWQPTFNWSFWAQWGYIDVVWAGLAYGLLPGFPPRIGQVYRFKLNTVAAKQDIREIVGQCGWWLRPQLWWFQVRRRPNGQVPGVLLARAFRYWPERRFWGVVYPALYVLFFVYVIAIVGWSNLTRHNVLVMLGISAGWWGIWGALTWLLIYLSRPRRRARPG